MSQTDIWYITDETGQQVAVQVGLARHHQLVEAQEGLVAIRAYDSAKASGEQMRLFENMVREVEQPANQGVALEIVL